MPDLSKWIAGTREARAAWHAPEGISRRITLSTLALSLALLTAAFATTVGILHWGLRNAVESDLEASVRSTQERFESRLNNYADSLVSLAANSRMAAALSAPGAPRAPEEAASVLKEYASPLPQLVSLVVYDRHGGLVAGDIREPSASAARAGAQSVLRNGRPYADIVADTRGRRVLRLFQPVASGASGIAAGVLLGAVDLDDVSAEAAQLPAESALLMEVATVTNLPLPHRPDYIEQVSVPTLAPPLDSLGLRLRLGRPALSAEVAVRQAMAIYAVLGIVTLLLALFAARRIGRRVVSPIREFATLAENFNSMIEKLSAAYAQSQAHEFELKALLENSPDMIARFDRELRCVYANGKVKDYLGMPPERIVNGTATDFGMGDSARALMQRLFRQGGEEIHEYNHAGRSFEAHFVSEHNAQGEVASLMCIMRDATARRAAEDSLREEQEQLQHQATHDALTCLPNRNLLTDRLAQAISYAQRYQRMVAVAFLDLDKFKHINDTMGHDVGDQLLKIVAERLSACVRDSDTVARLGGDEFVLVLYDQANEDITYHAMQRVLSSISQPMEIAGREMTITCSIGFAVYPQDGRDAETLIKNADTAMYRAKELGRDNFQFYTADLHTRINERLAMEAGLRRALQQDEFELHYQPRVDLASGKITALEALIRWNHPELGQIEPRRFVPLAEELGLIHRIGEWVLRESCRQQAAWQRAGVADLPISVNISAAQFLQKDFTQMIADILLDTPLESSRLELEITESLSMQDPEATIRLLRELKDMGVRVTIDDFGTGYSNLNYMKQFPVDIIKLDQSFVQDIVRNPEDLAISNAVISMAHSLHLKVTAEGVESATQLALLADHGCDEMQGFYFSAPLPVGRCTALLEENRVLPVEELGRRRTNRTILLVDDEPHVLSALERILRRTGCRILTANGALEAFDLMAMHEVGVIVSDQRMPGMTGVEFFARIRIMYPATVRMILSGYADIDAVTNAINVGAVYKFLNKPWDANELCAIVNDAFEKYEDDLQRLGRAPERRAAAC
ncbi:MAG TPA: EAL domain-containing protein [Noviherbaspirillum sp.]|nr:EAL domain-containing protein [Noviherbaspirillum sp.]